MKFKWCQLQKYNSVLFCSATVAGWGRTTRKRNRLSQMNLLQNKVNVETLQKLLVPVVNDQCTKSNSRVKIDPRIQLCAGGVKGWYISEF